jgi:hypothetical protein
MRIIYRKGILNEVDPLSRHPDFLSIDKMYMPDESLWWDGNVLGITYNGNDPALLDLSTLESLNIDNDYLSQFKGAYSSCNYFSNENIDRKKRYNIE